MRETFRRLICRIVGMLESCARSGQCVKSPIEMLFDRTLTDAKIGSDSLLRLPGKSIATEYIRSPLRQCADCCKHRRKLLTGDQALFNRRPLVQIGCQAAGTVRPVAVTAKPTRTRSLPIEEQIVCHAIEVRTRLIDRPPQARDLDELILEQVFGIRYRHTARRQVAKQGRPEVEEDRLDPETPTASQLPRRTFAMEA